MKTYMLAALAALTILFSGSAGRAQNLMANGPKAPAITAKDTSGRKVSLADYRGKVLLLDFWATWCPPCREEVPNVVRTYNTYHKRGFDILGISLDRDKAAVAPFTTANHMPWRQVFDQGSGYAVSGKYGLQAIPTMLLVDGDTGKVLAVNPQGEALALMVAAALKAMHR